MTVVDKRPVPVSTRPAPKMPRETRDRWCAALRSGDYTKGYFGYYQVVNDQPCHCALGVLLDITGPLRPGLPFTDPDSCAMRISAMLGPVEQQQIGNLNDYGHIMPALRSDDEPLTFDELADYIEDQVVCS